MDQDRRGAAGYEPPALRVLGSVGELTQGCAKVFGSTDTNTWEGQDIVCRSP
jgi:hypothetical protein